MTVETSDVSRWIRVERVPIAGSPALFLDRDGTVIENSPYLADPDGVRLIPGVREAVMAFRAFGFAVVVATNQSAIARGICSVEQYRAVETRVLELLGPGCVDVVYACPFHPNGCEPFARDHAWRKPSAGMLLDAAVRFQLDLGRSWMVGDSLSDIQAGANAGTGHLVHVATGHGETERVAVKSFAAQLRPEPDAAAPVIHYVPAISELSTLAEAFLNRSHEAPKRSTQAASGRDGVGPGDIR